MSWLEVAIENIKQQVIVLLEFNIQFWKLDDDFYPYLPPVANLICPNDCSDHGVCVQGGGNVCLCA
jgi:hypothetical protein